MQGNISESESTLTINDANITVKVLPPFRIDQLSTFLEYLSILNAKV